MLKDINFVIFWSLWIFGPLGIYTMIEALIAKRKAKRQADIRARAKADKEYQEWLHEDPQWLGE